MMWVAFQDSALPNQKGETETEGEGEWGWGWTYFNASSNISLLGTGWVTGAAVDTLF